MKWGFLEASGTYPAKPDPSTPPPPGASLGFTIRHLLDEELKSLERLQFKQNYNNERNYYYASFLNINLLKQLDVRSPYIYAVILFPLFFLLCLLFSIADFFVFFFLLCIFMSLSLFCFLAQTYQQYILYFKP